MTVVSLETNKRETTRRHMNTPTLTHTDTHLTALLFLVLVVFLVLFLVLVFILALALAVRSRLLILLVFIVRIEPSLVSKLRCMGVLRMSGVDLFLLRILRSEH